MRFLNQYWLTVCSSAAVLNQGREPKDSTVAELHVFLASVVAARPTRDSSRHDSNAAKLVAGRARAAFARDRRGATDASGRRSMRACLGMSCSACTLHAHTGAVASRLAGVRSGSFWAWATTHLARASASRAPGCNLFRVCFATRPLVWREIGLADLDLFHYSFTAVSPCWMRGRLCGLPGDPGGKGPILHANLWPGILSHRFDPYLWP